MRRGFTCATSPRSPRSRYISRMRFLEVPVASTTAEATVAPPTFNSMFCSRRASQAHRATRGSMHGCGKDAEGRHRGFEHLMVWCQLPTCQVGSWK